MQFEIIVQQIKTKRLSVTVADEYELDEMVDNIESLTLDFDDLDGPVDDEVVEVLERFEIED